MGSFYVLSLYLWGKQNRYNRNHPNVIKRRFLSVIVSSLFSVCFIYWLGQTAAPHEHHDTLHRFHKLNHWIGCRFDAKNLFVSVFNSLLLTFVLFLGPVLQNAYYFCYFEMDSFAEYEFETETGVEPKKNKNVRRWLNVLNNWRAAISSLDTWRNFIVGPFTEEFVFRSCMLPLLVNKLSFAQAVFITPLFSGLAHLHHIVEGYKPLAAETLGCLAHVPVQLHVLIWRLLVLSLFAHWSTVRLVLVPFVLQFHGFTAPQ